LERAACDAEAARRLRDVAVSVDEHALEVLPGTLSFPSKVTPLPATLNPAAEMPLEVARTEPLTRMSARGGTLRVVTAPSEDVFDHVDRPVGANLPAADGE
jgi:hypothetical protein